MNSQFPDSSNRERQVLEWVRRCLTVGHVQLRPDLTRRLGGLSLQDVLHALRFTQTPGTEIARDHWVIRGHNVDGIEIEVLVSVPVRTKIRLLRASLTNRPPEPPRDPVRI